jgi:hypothetical protein
MDLTTQPRLKAAVKRWATFKFGQQNVAILGYTNVEQSSKMGVTKEITFEAAVRFFGVYGRPANESSS